MRPRAFTLIEICVVLAMSALLVAAAWPPMREQMLRGHRADGVAALTRIQIAQEGHRALHGFYASQLGALAGSSAAFSPEGLYALALRSDGPDHYEAQATPRDGTAVAGDTHCPALVLRVHGSVAETGPTRRCWNR